MELQKPRVTLTCLGSGDAFGSGGRLQSCYHLSSRHQTLLLDCGCSVLSGLQRSGLQSSAIDTVVVSHLHGDHFGGIPFLLLDAKYAHKRTKPLALIGPAGLEQAVATLTQTLYPGTFADPLDFPVNYVELADGAVYRQPGFELHSYLLSHGRGVAFGLRLKLAERIIAYSGDSGWHDNLLTLARGSDLFIVECCHYRPTTAAHLDYQTLLCRQQELGSQRLLLTHMGQEVLERLAELQFPALADGTVVEL